MPGFNGTGPRGEGPLSGRGEGYCVVRLPRPASNEPVTGYAGLQGAPISATSGPMTQGAVSRRVAPPPRVWPLRAVWRVGKRGRRRARRFGRRGW